MRKYVVVDVNIDADIDDSLKTWVSQPDERISSGIHRSIRRTDFSVEQDHSIPHSLTVRS